MNQVDLRQVIAGQSATAHERFADLPGKEKIRVALEIFRLQTRLIFSQRLIWITVAVLVYMVFRYIDNYDDDVVRRLTQQDVINDLLAFPLVVLAIFLNMQLISSEKDRRTLEVMFTTAGSRYRIWLLRLATLNTVLFLFALGLSALAFFAFTDMSILGSAIYVFIPILFVGNVTLYFSVRFRSGLAAAMLTVLLLFISMIFAEMLQENGLYRYMLFFNPYALPRDIDPATWSLWTLQNKIGVVLAAAAVLFAAMRGLDRRERLLR